MRNLLNFALASLIIIIVSMFTSIASAKIEKSTICGVWLFNETGGDVAKDSSGNGNDGEVVGCEWADGKYGGGLEFKGENTYVNCGNSPTLDPEESLTLMAWVYIPDWSLGLEDWMLVLTRWKPAPATYHLAFQSATLKIHFNDDATTVADPDVSPANEWIHVAATADSASKKLAIYRNGSEVGETNYSGAINQNTQCTGIGTKLDSSGNPFPILLWFNGIMDEVAIFNVALTETEIQEAMGGLEKVTAVEKAGKLANTWGNIKE